MSMDDEEFREQREEKIAEIRRTGKTWQWPDIRQRESRPARQPMTRRDRQAVYFALAALVISAILLLVYGGA